MLRHVGKARRVLKDKGLLETSIIALQKVQKRRQQTAAEPARKIQMTMLAKNEDIVKARWSTNPYKPTTKKTSGPLTINWIMSPPGKGSGGHQNIFRFINFLEQKGHTCRVYLYSQQRIPTIAEIREVLKVSYPPTKATIEVYKGQMKPSDAIFATGWETAYPVFNDPSKARRFYFVQDFEPYFYPLGSEYVLAENTYKFNFFGITAGGWLSDKLSRDYGMQCVNYDFGAERDMYKLTNTGKRKEIFFYARPVTARRGFELGILALEIFHKEHPEYEITLAGWDVSEYHIPFPYKNLKSLSLDQLSEVYNNCAAALVISLTNMSLLPLELLACGTIPVVTDGENNRKVSNNKYIEYAPASPDALAASLHKVVTMKNLPDHAAAASKSVASVNWEKAGDKLEETLLKELHG